MPAARSPKASGIIDKLGALAPTRAANHAITLERYYRSATLLLTQANQYKREGNVEQQYVFLLRLAGIVIETIPSHKGFRATDAEYGRFKQYVIKTALPEAERLKLVLATRDIATPTAHSTNRPADAVQLGLSNLDGIDWSSHAPSAPAAPDYGAFLDTLDSGPSAPPAPSAAAAAAVSSSVPALPAADSSISQDLVARPSYQTSFSIASSEALQRHALFGYRTNSISSSGAAATMARPRYPGLSSTAGSELDALWDRSAAGPLSQLSLGEQLQQQAQLPAPSAGPSLGPQEVQVHSIDAGRASEQRVGTCSEPPPPDSFLHDEAGGPKPLPQRSGLRDVHISMALMNDFLHYASSNTRRGIESCGILAGTLSAGDSMFNVTTLIVPKQEGTSDTVAALNEEEIFEAQFSRGLYPLGWIHTHPTQTCFLSSVDVHTHCGYQTMLDEAIAIVMAPSDRKNKCGIFRLTTPGGLQLVQRCTLRGFHPHPATETGQDLYELCGHVYLNPRTSHEVLDLR